MREDRRKHERRASCMPAWVCDQRGGVPQQCHVMNISAGGVYILALTEPNVRVGKKVEITIGTHTNDHGGLDLHRCDHSARVVRTDQLGYATGLALQFSGQLQQMDSQHQLMHC